MKNVVLEICLLIAVAIVVMAAPPAASAQEAGNIVYNNRRPRGLEPAAGNLAALEPKEAVLTSFVEASVLMNVKADEYVAVFGLAQEAPTVAEGSRKLDAQLAEFKTGLAGLGIESGDIFVDFVNQNRVYDFNVAGASATARERLSGFEIKKNVMVHYREKALLERMLAAAARASVFDLIKVDYVVNNLPAVRERLLEEASKVIKRKAENYGRLFNMKVRPQVIYQEKYNAFYPSEMYASYAAYETGGADSGRVVEKRKSRTFYFNPLDSSDFDYVLNPLVVEPVVQFTLYLKVKYDLGAP